ncbi:YjeF N-terminal domain-like protein [Basidiobolus meristosporus CBS 931.73]|uniref:Enhancer of mRNA-decapping protein 3 n=1 Tax=Basidiobolus meristosporus CBS 931.73 TaxID=1314790 RepID=A0A1Y1ZCX9_9FUNG|nr:YjeF N-terminal domain-like protein [Basidiobolus meristosporus CBS 931.73]|eukprot:ORY07827.1 YjeF N-terminal domain-like protein [Basidiobolus meristosporus CBS 931.73]
MTEAFIGLRVKVSLSENFTLEGLVSSIDQKTQYLTLTNVLLFSNGTQQHFPTYGVAGPDIKDLQILPSQAPPPQPQFQAQPQHPVQNNLPPKPLPNNNLTATSRNAYPTSMGSPSPLNGSQYSPQAYITPSQVAPPNVASSQATLRQNPEQNQSSVNRKPKEQRQQKQAPTQIPGKYQEQTLSPSSQSQTSSNYNNAVQTQAKAPYIDPAIVSFTQPTPSAVSSAPSQESHRTASGPKKPKQPSYSGTPTSFIPPPIIELSIDDKADICLDYQSLRSDTESQLIMDSDALDSDQPHNIYMSSKSKKSKPKAGKQKPPPSPNKGLRNSKYPRSPGKTINGWASENVNDYKRQEFDFQHNLGLFDKKKVFAEIKESDSTDPDGLLVNINRNTGYKPTRAAPQNYGPLENVLERSRKQKYYEDDDEMDEEDNETANEESDLDTWKKNQEPIVSIRTLTGITCPFVSKAQMTEIEKIAATETGPSEDQIIENAGRSTAIMCLKALGGSRRIQPNNHNDAPLVVILAGNTKTGAYGLSAARHLTNHGCEVIVCVAGKDRDVIKSVAVQSKYLKVSGGNIVKSAAELPEPYTTPVDLIVDALLGYQPSARDSDHDYDLAFIGDLIDWANDNKAPVLSLDMPSGFKGQFNSGNAIRPKWTLCLGAPRQGLKSRNMTGEIFLADIGIPRILYKKVGVRGWRMPWGADYLIGLEYA